MDLLLFLIIGGLAGMLAGKIMSGHGYGILVDVALGIVGGFVGGWLVSTLTHHSGGGLVFSFLVSLLGACILVGLIRVIKHEPIRR